MITVLSFQGLLSRDVSERHVASLIRSPLAFPSPDRARKLLMFHLGRLVNDLAACIVGTSHVIRNGHREINECLVKRVPGAIAHYNDMACKFCRSVQMTTSNTSKSYIEPSQAAGRALVMRQMKGPVVMLNLLRFREIADYSATPNLAPEAAITGAAAFQRYIEHTLPYLRQSGGELFFLGSGGQFLIGPAFERWDMVMLVRQQSVDAFLAFASDEAYLAGIGHRTAALEDSRLLPLTQIEATR